MAGRRFGVEQLELRALLAGDLMHNAAFPSDVNNDGHTTPVDALFIINELNNGGARSLVDAPDLLATGLRYDVNNDAFLTPVDALLVLNELNAEGEDGDLVRIRVGATDVDGNAIETIEVGQAFQLRAYVQDLTARANGGVFAAYLDIEYDDALVSVDGPIVHNTASYGNFPSGSLSTPGLVDEAGSIDGLSPLGPNELVLFSINMMADAAGTVTFAPNPADQTGVLDVLLFGVPEGETSSIVAPERIEFVADTLQIGSIAAPQAVADSYEVTVNDTLTVSVAEGVLANDTNPTAETLTAAVASGPANGTLTLSADGSFTYVPNTDFVGQDSFTYTATAGGVTSNVATVTIDVLAGNSPPVAVNDAYSTEVNTTLTAEVSVLANDSDPDGDEIIAFLLSGPASGSVTLGANGIFTYVPAPGFTGTVSFTYIAGDDQDAFSDPATVTITVNPANEAPVANDDAYSVAEGSTLVVEAAAGVLDNDTDADGDTLTASLVSGPDNGTLTLNANGSFSYTPDAGFSGTDSFTYTAGDGTATSDPATVTITVTETNEAPVAVNDAYTVSSGVPLVVDAAAGVLDNDTDADGDTLTAQVVTGPDNGTLTLNANGSFTYTPDAGFAGTDSFTYLANDGLLNSQPATVTVTVTEPSGETQVRVRLETASAAGTPISSIGPGGTFVLNVYVQDVSEIPRDGVFAAYIDVLYDSDLVSVNGPIEYGEAYPNQQSGDVSVPGLIDEAGAFDGLSPLGPDEQLLFRVPMVANNAGVVDFTSNAADVLPAHDILLFNVSQPVPVDEVEYGTARLSIVSGDAPEAVDDNYETNEDTTLTVNAANGVLANDSDPEGDPLTAVLVDGPDNGTLTLNANGSFTYTPSANFNGTDVFTYRASDGALSSNVATVTIEVNPVDDAPVARDDSYEIETLGGLTVNAANGVLANDSDVEGQELTAVLVASPANGSLVLNADGSFTYTPVAGFVGQDTFTYRAVAGGVSSNIATVTIRVGDLTPSNIVGFVYSDTNNDGIMQSYEARYGGVRITLRGTDLLGNDVSRETETGADGSYRFDDLLQGQYTVTEFQPLNLIDGMDTINGQQSLRNDRFIVNLAPGVTAGNYNFGERGMMPEFIRVPSFFNSRTDHGLLAAFDASGQMVWYCVDAGWESVTLVDGQLNLAQSNVEIAITDIVGRSDEELIGLSGNRDLRLSGSAETGYLLRLTGDPSNFGLVPTSLAEGEMDADAIDAAFGDA